MPTFLDAPTGTELARRGFSTPGPLWSAQAIDEAPELLGQIHADFAAAGAHVHTACTFRTSPWTLAKLGRDAAEAARLSARAVAIARAALPEGAAHLVAGSVAPLEDCYRPDLSPSLSEARIAHAATARQLVRAGVDLLLCETFAHPGESLCALDACLEHGLPVWFSLSPGPAGDLLDESRLIETLCEGARRGAEVVLINCAPLDWLDLVLPKLAERLEDEMTDFGVYGNVGRPCDEHGWLNEGEAAPEPYAEATQRWLSLGASVIGGCCGTSPEHIAAAVEMAERLKNPV